MARSRTARASRSEARSAAILSRCEACLVVSTPGRRLSTRGERRRAATSEASSPSSKAQVEKVLMEAERRARVARDCPLAASAASPSRRSGEAQEVAHVDEIGAHGVRGQIPLQGQVPTVGGEEVGARPWHGGSPWQRHSRVSDRWARRTVRGRRRCAGHRHSNRSRDVCQ